MQPATAPSTGAQRRHAPVALNASTTIAASVTAALVGAAVGDVPSGTCVSRSKTIGITVTGISMITVPATLGVMIRLSQERRQAIANWKSHEATIRVASMPGPPCVRAVTQTAMKAPEVPISRM